MHTETPPVSFAGTAKDSPISTPACMGADRRHVAVTFSHQSNIDQIMSYEEAATPLEIPGYVQTVPSPGLVRQMWAGILPTPGFRSTIRDDGCTHSIAGFTTVGLR